MSQPDTEPETRLDTAADTHRMLITVEYDGTGLVGWQRQNNGPSVQACLEAAAEKLTSRKTPIQGSGRTDAGVHASAQAAHLDVPTSLNTNAVVNGLNAWLDCPQVSVLNARRVGQDFNARFDATERSYLYRILDRRTPSALRRHHVWHHRTKLNVDAMHEAAQYLIGKHDFSSFRATGCQANSPVRTLNSLSVTRSEDEIHIRAHARSFLYHQIRNFAGSLALVGAGKWQAEDIRIVLEACDRTKAGPTAPPQGLYLTEIEYSPESLAEK